MRSVLISGAGVAGLTTAYWLHRRGFAPTVVERAVIPRLGGQPIDVRGSALGVVERMGILDEVRQARTRIVGMSIVDADGKELERITDWTISTGPLGTQDVELLRDTLTRLLQERASDGDGIEYVYGDSITALEQDAQGVRVKFERGQPRTFDFVVGADGLHSKVRQLAFGPDSKFMHHMGTYLSVCTSDNFLKLDNWQLWHRGETAGYIIFPVRDNAELRITLTFQSGPMDYDYRDSEQQKKLVAERLAHLGGEAPKLIQAMMKARDFYFVAMAQIHMEHCSRGRVALCGDAGYCASPLSGQGTSLALVGAYVLADELARAGDDYRSAFTRYEERIRTYVKLNQAIPLRDPTDPGYMEKHDQAKNGISIDP
jgi:2-polyprenyl-6-methoxyphenol hydroxylase-like FAD-dependent oxidoreductase